MNHFRKFFRRALALTALITFCSANGLQAEDGTFRVLSWNISDDAFVAEQEEFHALLKWADPDIVLLDEVDPTASVEELTTALSSLRLGNDSDWHINFGVSGRRERAVIASRAPQETLPEFNAVVPYPEDGRKRILEKVPPDKRSHIMRNLYGGIAINGSVILVDGKRLLVLIADLQCCGDGPESWEELKRRVEAAEIRRLITGILEYANADGIVLAGDFNLVESTFPMTLLTGPLPAPHSGLIPAELYHPDGTATWTWDGRDTPFPSNTLDYQFYGPRGLKLLSGFILDTESLSAEVLRMNNLDGGTAGRTGRHRPLIAEYGWQ